MHKEGRESFDRACGNALATAAAILLALCLLGVVVMIFLWSLHA